MNNRSRFREFLAGTIVGSLFLSIYLFPFDITLYACLTLGSIGVLGAVCIIILMIASIFVE